MYRVEGILSLYRFEGRLAESEMKRRTRRDLDIFVLSHYAKE